MHDITEFNKEFEFLSKECIQIAKQLNQTEVEEHDTDQAEGERGQEEDNLSGEQEERKEEEKLMGLEEKPDSSYVPDFQAADTSPYFEEGDTGRQTEGWC